jgi:hypothetical protein
MAGLFVITGGVVCTTETVVRAGLIIWRLCLACEIQRSAEEGAGLAKVALGEHDFAQAVERPGLVGEVTHLPEQNQGTLKVVSGLPMAA